MKKYKLPLLILLLILIGCRNITSTESEIDEGVINDDAEDYVWDHSDDIQIALNGNTIQTNGDGLSVDGNVVTITSAGTYGITGTLDDGQIIVDTDDEELVRLILNEVDIYCASSSPIYVDNAAKVMLVMEDDTENDVSDGSNYTNSDDAQNAAIFSKSDLTIYGNGTLNVDANFNDGIASKDGLIISSGNINIESVDDGIRGKDYLLIKDGNINITSGGTGIKSDNMDDSSLGYIIIRNGIFDITSDGEAIESETNIEIDSGEFILSSKGKAINGSNSVTINNGNFNIYAKDDGIHSNGEVIIEDGNITISTNDDGIHADDTVTINNGKINIEESYEGIEGKYIYSNDGEISIIASDDGFNATAGQRTERNDNSCLYLYGGYIVVDSGSDGLDSNGNMELKDGTVIVHGPTRSPEVMFDYNGTFKISGGLFVAIGSSSNMLQGTSSNSSQYSILIRFSSTISSSTLLHIEDSNENDIITFQSDKRYQTFIVSSPDLKKNEQYSIYLGGNSTGENIDGVYNDGSYSNGTLYKTFTLSSILTYIH